jgi:putative ABC transport system permease protein
VRTEGIVTFGLSLPAANYPGPTQAAAFYDGLLAGLSALPGVEGASAVSVLPLTGVAGRSDFLPEGEAPPAEGVPGWNAQLVAARPDYFQVVGIPLVEGRLPDASDGPESFPVAVINEATARRYFSEASPVGRRITFGWSDSLWITVIGVVGDTRHDPRAEPEPMIYLNHAQIASGNLGAGRVMSVVVRAAEPERLPTVLRATVAELDPRLPLSDLLTFEEVVARSVARPRLTANLLGAFAALALLLAMVGVWGVVSYDTARRTREIALRLALGAGRRQVTGMVVADGARPVVLGAAVGLAAALLTARLLEGLLFEVSPTDPLTFAVVPTALLVVALLATWLPARRATRVEPSEALREE